MFSFLSSSSLTKALLWKKNSKCWCTLILTYNWNLPRRTGDGQPYKFGLPDCQFASGWNSKYWFLPLKTFMSWVKVISGTAPSQCPPCHASRRGMLRTCQSRNFSWRDIGKQPFLPLAPVFWNIMVPEIRPIPVFWPSKRVWRPYQLAWSPNRGMSFLKLVPTSDPNFFLCASWSLPSLPFSILNYF